MKSKTKTVVTPMARTHKGLLGEVRDDAVIDIHREKRAGDGEEVDQHRGDHHFDI